MLCSGVPMLLFIYYYGQIVVKLKIQFDWFASETGEKGKKAKYEEREERGIDENSLGTQIKY